MGIRIGLLTIALCAAHAGAGAQEPGRITLGAGTGATFYCIDTRCNAGAILGLSSGYQLTSVVGVDFSGRWHTCSDCDRFLIGDAAVLVQYPGERIRPYAGGGAGYSSDPGFMGSHFGLLAAVGAATPLTDLWVLRADVRGRRVGSSGSMAEFTVWLHYRMSRR